MDNGNLQRDKKTMDNGNLQRDKKTIIHLICIEKVPSELHPSKSTRMF